MPYPGGADVPKTGCGSPYHDSATFWNPRHYFAARDRQWGGTVTVGNLQDATAPGRAKRDKRSAGQIRRAPASSTGH